MSIETARKKVSRKVDNFRRYLFGERWRAEERCSGRAIILYEFSAGCNFTRDSLTIEHMNEDAGWLGSGWRAGVIAGIGRQRSADQKTWRSRLLFRHDANAPALAVIYHVVALVPEKSWKIIWEREREREIGEASAECVRWNYFLILISSNICALFPVCVCVCALQRLNKVFQ